MMINLNEGLDHSLRKINEDDPPFNIPHEFPA